MKKRQRVSLRTLQRHAQKARQREKDLEAVIIEASSRIRVAEHTIKQMDDVRARVAKAAEIEQRLDRIREIVEEIAEHYQLPEDVRRELFEAVHYAKAARWLMAHYHVRTSEPTVRPS